jgi:protein gp37
MESAKRMLSLEPLLGPIDLLRCGAVTQSSTPSPTGLEVAPYDYVNANVYFITTGGESGPTARPALPYNVSNIVDVCSQLQIPLFFSGWGEWLPDGQKAPSEGSMRRALIRQADEESLRMVRPNPSGSVQGWTRVWNKHSGRMIDGIEWTELPWLTT